jgi:hypothetical protein
MAVRPAKRVVSLRGPFDARVDFAAQCAKINGLGEKRLRIIDALKRHVAGLGKFHREATLAQVAAEMLAEQHLDIRFIVDNKNK